MVCSSSAWLQHGDVQGVGTRRGCWLRRHQRIIIIYNIIMCAFDVEHSVGMCRSRSIYSFCLDAIGGFCGCNLATLMIGSFTQIRGGRVRCASGAHGARTFTRQTFGEEYDFTTAAQSLSQHRDALVDRARFLRQGALLLLAKRRDYGVRGAGCRVWGVGFGAQGAASPTVS